MTAPANFRTRRSALNFGTGLVYTAVTVLIGFVSTPLILRWLGTERFGALRAAQEWFGHLSLAELGLAGALSPLLAAALARRDARTIQETVAEGIRAFVLVFVIALLAGAGLGLVIGRLVPVSPALTWDLRRAWMVAVAGLVLYPLLPFRLLMDAEQRGYAINLLLTVQAVLSVGLAVLLAWAGWGITGQFLAILAGQVVFTLAVTRDGLMRVPGLVRAVAARSTAVRERLWRLNTPTLLANLSGRVSLLTDNMVLALLLGPERVVPYYLTQRFVGLTQTQLQSVGNASWAAFSELHELGRSETFNERLVELTSLIAGLGVVSLVPIVAYNRAFVTLWVGAERYGGDLVTVAAAVSAYILSIQSLWGWCLTATGQIGRWAPASAIGAAVNLAASILLTLRVGIAGPLLGNIVGFLAVTAWVLPWQLHRAFATPVAALARAALATAAYMAPLAAVLVLVARRFEPRGWLSLLAQMAATGVLLLAFWWFVVLRPSQRAGFRERLRAATRAREASAG